LTLAASLDTNILVRLLVQDDEQQALMAAKFLARYVNQASLFVPVTVVLELEWVLRARYKFRKAEVLSALSSLLTTFELVFESEDALEQALDRYQDGDADFAECLHLALASKEKALPFMTFDVAASKQAGAALLK
jgi:predicted nucleic-acid-binding protein